VGKLTRVGARTIPREHSMNMALHLVGWLGQTGQVYPLGAGPSSEQEPGGFSPLYASIGTWEDLGDGRWGIHD